MDIDKIVSEIGISFEKRAKIKPFLEKLTNFIVSWREEQAADVFVDPGNISLDEELAIRSSYLAKDSSIGFPDIIERKDYDLLVEKISDFFKDHLAMDRNNLFQDIKKLIVKYKGELTFRLLFTSVAAHF